MIILILAIAAVLFVAGSWVSENRSLKAGGTMMFMAAVLFFTIVIQALNK